MARTRRTGIGNDGGRSAQCQSVQIIVNPKTCRMDKTMRDILSISELVTGQDTRHQAEINSRERLLRGG